MTSIHRRRLRKILRRRAFWLSLNCMEKDWLLPYADGPGLRRREREIVF